MAIKRILSVSAVTLICILYLTAGSTLWAQTATGRIIGKVTDPTGAVVPGVKVTATNTATGVNYDTITNDIGDYQILLLPIGEYKVSAELTGFQKVVTKPQTLELNQAMRMDLKLEVGQAVEVVEVESAAPAIETVSAALGNSVIGNQIANMPLNGRNVLDLALLMPGVIPVPSGSGAGNGTFSVAGARGDSVTYLLDGGVNNNLLSNAIVFNPNPDTIGEFHILTNNYSAEYGRNAGGIVSVVTKSGSNQFHGTAYDYVRNDALNANSFFNNANGLRKEILKRNQFGGTISGPVKKDKLFFFSGWQSQRQSQLQTTAKTTVFTPAELNGDFSHSNASGTGPDANVAAFLQKYPYFQPNAALAAQGIIDPSKFNSVSKNYIKAGLIPTSPSGSLISQGSAHDDNDELTNKADYQLSDSDRVAVTLGWRKRTVLGAFAPIVGSSAPNVALANVPGFPNQTITKNYFLAANYVKTITPTLLNEFRFTAQRNNNLQAVPATKLATAKDLGIAITPDESTGPPILGFSSGITAGFSPQGPSRLIDNTFTWSDSLTWIKSKHTVKTGFTYSPYQDNQVFDFYINGEFFFRGGSSSITPYSRNDRADFLMGFADEFLQFPAAPSNIRTKNFGGFFQDEWKVRDNLTLTLGVRYEYNTPKLDTQGRTFTYLYGAKSTVFTGAPVGLVFPGDSVAPKGSNFPDRNDWAPRIGFAWTPTASGKFVIRGGGGVFYDILKAEDNFQFNGQAPFFPTADLNFDPLMANPTGDILNFTQPYVAAGTPNPFPTKPTPKDANFAQSGFLPFGGGGVYSVDPHIRTPYIYQYNLDLQQELRGGTVVDVAYAGSSSHKLTGLFDQNPFPLGGTTRIFNSQPGNAPGSFSYLDTFGNVANAHYNSLQLGVRRIQQETPVIGSVGYQLSYTFSKSMDNGSGFRARNSRVPYYNRSLFKAVSDFDIPHYFSLSGEWELPFQKMWSNGPSRLLGKWNLLPIITYRTGTPLDVTGGISRNVTRPGPSGAGDQNLVRANLVKPITIFDPHQVQTLAGKTANFYFDTTAFQSVPNVAGIGNYGMLGRNAFRAPSNTNVNVTITKVIPVREELKFEYRVDFFNLLNNAQFNPPQTSITSGTFGQISTTRDPRIIQMALRIQF